MPSLEELATKGVNRWDVIPAYYDFVHFGNKIDDVVHKLPEVWEQNAATNLPWLKENQDRIGSVYDLPKYGDKAIIFVGASPILKKTWHHLKQADDRFIIVAVNSSAKFLLDRGIKPHYIICIDGKPGNWTLNLGKKLEGITGIFSAFVEPNVLRDWPGKILIVPYTHKGEKQKKITSYVRRKWGKGLPSGGNAFNAAFAVFSMCTDAKIFLFAGNELSFKRNYYVHSKSENDELPYYRTRDVNGKMVKILTALFTYKVWLETMMQSMTPPYVFYNCSEGILGVDTDGSLLKFVKQKNLGIAIEEVKDAFDFEKIPWDAKNKYMYNVLYQDELDGKKKYSWGLTSRGIWEFVREELPPFTKGLDVGCGKGDGVKEINDAGFDVYGVDVSDTLEAFWKERGIFEKCRVASAHRMPFQDNEFDLVVSTEMFEHIPEEAIDDVLQEIYRVGSDKFLFTISLYHDARKGVFLHLLVKDERWWEAKLGQHGFQIAYSLERFQHEVQAENRSAFIYAVKNKEPYLSGERKLVQSDTEYSLFVPFGKGSVSYKKK